jgi:hypothetical protein
MAANPDSKSLRPTISGGTKLALPIAGSWVTHLKEKTM